MSGSPTRHVKKARKTYRCDWCWEWIEIGQPYATWFAYGENVVARVHPECFVALVHMDLCYDDTLPIAGTYRRGCWCGESEDKCTCEAGKDGGK